MRKTFKCIGLLFVLFLCVFMQLSVVSAEDKRIPVENIDCDCIRAISINNSGYSEGGIGKETYLFTEKSAGRYIPLKAEVTGVMYFSIPNKVELLDENKEDTWTGNGYDEPVVVKKDKTYYIKLPDVIVEAKYEMHFYVYPSDIKCLENGREAVSIGTGRYVYYSFQISEKCLGRFEIQPAQLGDSSVSFKIQKKVSGKWKDITHVRKVRAVTYLTEPYNAIGLSKGKYRLGIKTSKEQMAWMKLAVRGVKVRMSEKKSKAITVKKGKQMEGMFTWEDKKAHWFKVKKTRKNKLKTICVYGGSLDDMVFTIYRRGKTDALITWKFHADKEADKFIKYKRKCFALKDNGTYYIKVNKANKKTNGAYKIGVK